MPICEECQKHSFNRCLFDKKWVCADCYRRLVRERDEKYYRELQALTRVRDEP